MRLQAQLMTWMTCHAHSYSANSALHGEVDASVSEPIHGAWLSNKGVAATLESPIETGMDLFQTMSAMCPGTDGPCAADENCVPRRTTVSGAGEAPNLAALPS